MFTQDKDYCTIHPMVIWHHQSAKLCISEKLFEIINLHTMNRSVRKCCQVNALTCLICKHSSVLSKFSLLTEIFDFLYLICTCFLVNLTNRQFLVKNSRLSNFRIRLSHFVISLSILIISPWNYFIFFFNPKKVKKCSKMGLDRDV